jgi:hypothetical protein
MTCSETLRRYVISRPMILFTVAACLFTLVPSTAQAQVDVEVEKHVSTLLFRLASHSCPVLKAMGVSV